MKTLLQIPKKPVRYPRPVVALGIFDGVHVGHQVVLKQAVDQANAIGGTPMALSFYPHPMQVLAPDRVPQLLLSLEQRLACFQEAGMRAALIVPFTKHFATWSAHDFVERVLVKALQAKVLLVGHDFGFGKGRSGNVELLKKLGKQYGFSVKVIAPIRRSQERVSSRQIRALIHAGELKKAERWLTRPVQVAGTVVKGQGKGRTLGFSTANIKVASGLLPPIGVYAVTATVRGRQYAGMANIGVRPTFYKETKDPVLEVHLFGRKASLLKQKIQVSFVQFLRPEQRFANADALVRQLHKDEQAARRIVAKIK